ncbi:MAG: N-acetylmuramoyl-L-alanine amidase [Alphaproteobacteria bacterium]|jgi:N-acetylmuramoyl-L-alanine amidase
MDIISFPSQNFDQRAFLKPDMVIIHYTGMKTADDALQKMCSNTQPRVSAHYFIHKNGTIFQLINECNRAWHAGLSIWEGEKDINSRSIGIELDNKGHEFGYQNFPKVQIQSLIWLLSSIRARHNIDNKHIIGHSDIAPMRKKDPGFLFPWHILAQNGHGIAPKKLKKMLYHTKRSNFLDNLSDFGYGCDSLKILTPLNRKVVETFNDKCPY